MQQSNVQCIKLFQTCSGSTPKCYQSGSSASCVECLTDTDCPANKPKCNKDTHKCEALPCSCDSGATPCGECSFVSGNIGKRCVNVNNQGTGYLQDDKSCSACVKYSVDGIKTEGMKEWIPEVCLDSYNSATKKYEGYKADDVKTSATGLQARKPALQK